MYCVISEANETSGYLIVEANGGLNQQRSAVSNFLCFIKKYLLVSCYSNCGSLIHFFYVRGGEKGFPTFRLISFGVKHWRIPSNICLMPLIL